MQALTERATHILIVEDDVGVGDMLTLLLESEGYRVSWRRSVATALAFLLPPVARDAAPPSAADAHGPDRILLDLQLGASSGVTLMQRVAAQRTVPPVVVLSASDGRTIETASSAIGAVAMLTKPFLPADLLRTLASVVAAGPGPPDTGPIAETGTI